MKKEATMNGKPSETAMEITRRANKKLSQDSKDLLPNLDNQRRNVSKCLEKYYPKHPKAPKKLEEVPYRKSTMYLPDFTVFENHRKSLIQQCERSKLHLHLEWIKIHGKCQKCSFWRVF